MKEKDMRALLRESDSKPIRICMDDGKTYVISHPDFGMVADGAVIIGAGPGNNLRGATFVVCYLEQISRVETLKSSRSKAA